MSSERHDAMAGMAETGSLGSPGQTLREAREARSMSVAEVAQELKISRQAVERLEQGQYDSLPGDTFARGYIRSYARLMGMDPARLALAFDRERGIEVRERSVSSIARVEPPSRSGRTLMWWSSVLIIVALVLSALWWYETNQPSFGPLPGLEELDSETLLDDVEVDAITLPESIAEQTDGLPADLMPVESAPAEVEAESGAAPTNADETTSVQEAATQRDTADADAAAADAAPTEPAAPASSAGLVLSVAADCWVQVSAADGRVLHSALMRAGQTLELPSSGPLDLVIGDRSAVTEIRFQGNSVTLPPQGRSGVVRMRLGE
jgi:cytoskeleton protein RodZ